LKISICIATYNGSSYVAEQISSIISQLSEGDEILIADDGSTDKTLVLLQDFQAHVRIVGTERVGGVVANFERVLKAARGEGIVLCDQDDVWLPGRLDAIRSALAAYQLVLINGEVVDEHLERRGQTIFDAVSARPGFWTNLLKNSFIGCCMAFRRDLLERILPFPIGVPWHDWYIGLVAECSGSVVRIPQISMLYRRHGGNFSPTGEKSRNSLLRKVQMRLAVTRAVLIALCRRPLHRNHVGSL
jgi:glycosyltransferase involved in cell wall biosynthesis